MRFFKSLGLKLTVTTAIFLLLLGIGTAWIIMVGFRQTQATATQRSIEGLEEQGRSAMLELAEREAQIYNTHLLQGAISSRLAVDYMVHNRPSVESPFPFNTLYKHRNGTRYDPNPTRISEIYISPRSALNDVVSRDLRQSAVLDAIVPSILAEFTNTTAVYFIAPNDILRYFPVINLVEVTSPDLVITEQPFFTLAAPAANPERESRWTKPYIDPAGQGVMVSVSTPVYIDDQFRGVIGADITLDDLIVHLNNLTPTPNGFAFLIDRDGQLVVGSPHAVQMLTNAHDRSSATITDTLGLVLTDTSDPILKATLETMIRRNSSGVEMLTLNAETVVLAYAPLDATGWTLGIVAPLNEVTAQAAAVDHAIQLGIQSTIRKTLSIMVLVFLCAIGLMILLSRRLTKPIQTLMRGTQAVAAGDLTTVIPVDSNDELGILAVSFNQMIADLSQAQHALKAWNLTLERTVEERTHELEAAYAEAKEARVIAEQANAMKSKFLANMSHELRTPLNAIINFSHFIQADGGLSDEQNHLIQRVAHNGEHLLGIINDILDLSKIEAGQLEIHPELIAPLPLLQSVMATAVGFTKDKGLELMLDVVDELPAVWVDKMRTRQVLLNLLSNAAKFTAAGRIAIRAGFDSATHLRIAVEDSGIGIAPEDQERIFEEFQQAHNHAYDHQGTGLGLPISKRFIELQGGRMWLESVSGQGSTFYFTLPLADTVVAAPSRPANGQQAVDIVIVDDNPDAQTTLQRLLTSNGFCVTGVLDSRDAVATIQALHPRLVILDIQMPHRTGWDVLVAIKDIPEIACIPIIICSIVDDQRLGVLLGVHGHIVKPVREGMLLATVQNAIGSPARILVVDDDPDARRILRTILNRHGWDVVEANDGLEALMVLQSMTPDLMILDLMMPQLDGFGVLSRLQALPPSTRCPVVIVSAHDLEPAEREYLHQQSIMHLQKGQISDTEFSALIKQHLQGGDNNDCAPSSNSHSGVYY